MTTDHDWPTDDVLEEFTLWETDIVTGDPSEPDEEAIDLAILHTKRTLESLQLALMTLDIYSGLTPAERTVLTAVESAYQATSAYGRMAE